MNQHSMSRSKPLGDDGPVVRIPSLLRREKAVFRAALIYHLEHHFFPVAARTGAFVRGAVPVQVDARVDVAAGEGDADKRSLVHRRRVPFTPGLN